MNINDFTAGDNEVEKLKHVDGLVARGLSRERSERLVKQLYEIIEGPWTDILKHKRLDDRLSDEELSESIVLQTFFVAYVYQWAQDRMLISAAKQSLAFGYFSRLDADKKEAR